jgi:hypothetical protein
MNEQGKMIFLMMFLMMIFVSLFVFSDFLYDDDVCNECEVNDRKDIKNRFSKLDSLKNNYFQAVNFLSV